MEAVPWGQSGGVIKRGNSSKNGGKREGKKGDTDTAYYCYILREGGERERERGRERKREREREEERTQN